MKSKKTKAQKDYEREMKNLKARIKRLETQGWIIDADVKAISETKYKDTNPSRAYQNKLKATKLKGEMLRRKGSLETPSGVRLRGTDAEGYRSAKRKQRREEKSFENAAERVMQDRFGVLTAKNKRGLSNFYKGFSTLYANSDTDDINILRLLNAMKFMQTLSPGKQIIVIKRTKKGGGSDFIGSVYGSDILFADIETSVEEISEFEAQLQKFGYKIPSDDELKKKYETREYLVFDRKFIYAKA